MQRFEKDLTIYLDLSVTQSFDILYISFRLCSIVTVDLSWTDFDVYEFILAKYRDRKILVRWPACDFLLSSYSKYGKQKNKKRGVQFTT